jgi:hypothetical protein
LLRNQWLPAKLPRAFHIRGSSDRVWDAGPRLADPRRGLSFGEPIGTHLINPAFQDTLLPGDPGNKRPPLVALRGLSLSGTKTPGWAYLFAAVAAADMTS